MGEFEAARGLLRQSEPMRTLKEQNTEKYMKLENIVSHTVLTGEVDKHIKDSKVERRRKLAQSISDRIEIYFIVF